MISEACYTMDRLMQLAVATPDSSHPLNTARTLLLLLVAADLAFIVLHVLYIETSLLPEERMANTQA